MTEEAKRAVLDNIENISAEDLYVKYIKPGYISLSAMKETGKLDFSKRKKIEELVAQEGVQEEQAWSEAQKKATTEAYADYLRNYPNGKYKIVAESVIAAFRQNEMNENKNKKDLLEKLRRNPNGGFTPRIVNDHLNKGTINITDLREAGIPQEVIDSLSVFKEPRLTLGEIPPGIPSGFTEVYFWGIPGSGKTCALSGILGYANESGVLDTASGPGFHYMTQLKNIFRSQIGFLPAATSTEATQCLPFELKDDNGKKHPIALIELSGEIFRCYYYLLAGMSFPDADHIKTFENVTRYLNGPNRKIHFFVFDLSKDPRKKDDHGLCQDDYLNAAQTYFKQNNIFKNYTDAIYIIATKSDLLDPRHDKRIEKAATHLKENYPSFVDVLKDACKRYKINDNNHLRVLPFSLGDVYFNYICKFNSLSSSEIITILKNKTGVLQGKSILNEFFNR